MNRQSDPPSSEVLVIGSLGELARICQSRLPEDRERLRWGSAPQHVWLEALQHPELRSAIALNKRLPADVLRALARDADGRVRSLVAMKRTLPGDVFEVLSHDKDEGIRALVARNPKAPPGVIEMLREDPSPLVRDALHEEKPSA